MASQSGLRVVTSQAPPVIRTIATRRPTPGFTQLTRLLVLAAAGAGVVEIGLARVAAPIVSHVPSSGIGADIASAVIAGADAAVGATLVLVVAATAVLVVGGGTTHRAVRPLLGASLVSVFAHILGAPPLIAAASYIAVGTTAAWIGFIAFRARGPVLGLAVAGLVFAYIAGMLPIVLGSAPGGTLVHSAAEGAVLASAALVAIHAVREGVTRRRSWWVSAGAGLVAAAFLAVEPANTAAVSLWATGVTLSLPPVAYVVAASCLGLVVAEWISTPSRRHLAAGLALVAAAGIGPGLVHHNITAILGLAVLTVPAAAPRAGSDADTTIEEDPHGRAVAT